MIKIGDFSKLSNLSVKMLRHYDEIELLVPIYIDNSTNYRYYAPTQLEIARRIDLYKKCGFRLEDIRTMLQYNATDKSLHHFYKKQRNALTTQHDNLSKKEQQLEQLFSKSNVYTNKKYHMIEKTIPQRHVISRRRIITSYDHERELWDELYIEMERLNISPIYDGFTMAIYHDNEYFDSGVDVEVQVSVQSNCSAYSDTVTFKDIPAIDVASIIFSGSYQQMPYVSQAAATWLSKNNYNLGALMFHIFHISPAQSIFENDWVTEACYTLVKKTEEK